MLLRRDYGYTVENLFDTMVAARVLGHHYYGLASIMKHYFGVKMDKSHQRDNWGARPLPQESLQYAQMDTHYLPELRDLLEQELVEMGRWEEAKELFEEAQNVPPANDVYDPNGFWKIGRSNRLRKHQMGVLREVYLLREELAAAEDTPAALLFSNKALIQIARRTPRSLQQLDKIREIHGAQVRRYGADILDAVERGRQAKPRPPAPDIANRYVALQRWRKAKGIERGVESDVVLPKDLMWQLARHVPQTIDDLQQIPGLGPKRIELYGTGLLAVLNR
jgi:ribonuclease D